MLGFEQSQNSILLLLLFGAYCIIRVISVRHQRSIDIKIAAHADGRRGTRMNPADQFKDVFANWEKRRQGGGPPSANRSSRPNYKYKPSEPMSWSGGRRSRQNNRDPFKVNGLQKFVYDHYKTMPSVSADNANLRPNMGRCCQCMPNSRDRFYEDSMPTSGLKDILRVDEEGRNNPLIVQWTCHIVQVMRRDVSHKYPDVSIATATSPSVVEAIRRVVIETGTEDEKESTKLLEEQRKKVRKIIHRMKATISNRLIRFTGWFLQKLLGHLLSTLQVHKGQMDIISKASEDGVPMIYLPIHRSHLDYILLTFILFNYDIQAPHVAAGDNLLIPFFSLLMKGLGGYFIRRQLDLEKGKKDILYRAVLHEYMLELLKNKQSFEFFIEGGRSRSGKPMIPKGGLLSVIVDGVSQGAINDAYIVPVSITYEKILDGNFNKEQMGEKKEKETFWRAVIGIWRVLNQDFGNVRVEFCQPFSLQEYLSSSQLYCQKRSRSTTPPRSPCDQKPMGSASSLYGAEVLVETQRNIVKSIAQHVIHTCMQAQTVMSTNAVSFLLLTLHRKGCTVDELASSVMWLREELMLKGRDVGFSGEPVDIVLYACIVLGSHLVQQSIPDNDSEGASCNPGCIRLKPTIQLPHVFELVYYGNVAGTAFVLDSVIATACYAICNWEEASMLGNNLTISKQRLMECATQLCEILQFEYTFNPPCSSLDNALSDALEQFIVKEIFYVDEDDTGYSTKDKEWAQRLAKSVDFDNSSDSDGDDLPIPDRYLKVNLEVLEHKAMLHFLKSYLAPIVESYWIAGCQLAKLQEDQPEEDFLLNLQKHTRSRVNQGLTDYCESVSMDSLKNAMKAFETMKVTIIYYAGNLRMIGLSDAYKNQQTLCNFIEKLEKYKSY
ncbi:unnamed protein product [Owenia fusiformis]|uniref:Phospholipid/glycerol acyltransferase domain-containing protein n=1 Tax=Owenia fusiformis TaxID=6347 RepID=A0A8S4NU44_OWEFU|nr:unnamed protein product [Owenia fusiformis]